MQGTSKDKRNPTLPSNLLSSFGWAYWSQLRMLQLPKTLTPQRQYCTDTARYDRVIGKAEIAQCLMAHHEIRNEKHMQPFPPYGKADQ